MRARILSKVVGRELVGAVVAIGSISIAANVNAQTGPGYFTDPNTGIVYRKVAQTIERPVVETKMETQEQVVYTPQTVHETKPEARVMYTPVVESTWEPRVTGRWNPFVQPTVSYHHVPRTRWEARTETVQRTQTRTNWVPETRKIDVPKQIVRMERQEKVDFEPVGRVAPQATPPGGVSEAIASRLRPLDQSERIEPIGGASSYAAAPSYGYSAPRVAATTVGRMTSDPPRRSFGQGGMSATNLMPSTSGGLAQPLPPTTTSGIANLPALPFFR